MKTPLELLFGDMFKPIKDLFKTGYYHTPSTTDPEYPVIEELGDCNYNTGARENQMRLQTLAHEHHNYLQNAARAKNENREIDPAVVRRLKKAANDVTSSRRKMRQLKAQVARDNRAQATTGAHTYQDPGGWGN